MTLQVRGSEAEIVPLTNQRGDPIEAMATGELLTGTWRVAIRGRRGRAHGQAGRKEDRKGKESTAIFWRGREDGRRARETRMRRRMRQSEIGGDGERAYEFWIA